MDINTRTLWFYWGVLNLSCSRSGFSQCIVQAKVDLNLYLYLSAYSTYMYRLVHAGAWYEHTVDLFIVCLSWIITVDVISRGSLRAHIGVVSLSVSLFLALVMKHAAPVQGSWDSDMTAEKYPSVITNSILYSVSTKDVLFEGLKLWECLGIGLKNPLS